MLLSININGQQYYNVVFDSTYIAAIMDENIIVNNAI